MDTTLTAAQQAAVQHIDGPLLILAGPGSGKTRVVTHRIAYLLEQGIEPHQIVALTFTNKAADEMRARVERLLPGRDVWLSTFHRFCARLLRRYAPQVGLPENFTIYDTNDSLRALRHAIEAAQLDMALYSPAQVATEISRAKNDLIDAQSFESRPGRPISSVVAEVYPAYQKRLLASAAVDFDDLLLHMSVLLRDNPEIRALLDERFRYVLIDEYQDTNRAQYAILRALSHDYPNLAATGDPDQSIFGWRGANLNNILQFERDFSNVRVVRLEQNYRSTQNILNVADALIANNQLRKPKRLFTDKPAGTPVKLAIYATEKQEAEAIAERIANAITSGRRPAGDFAVFYRINALSRTLEMALADRGVPYQLVRGLEFFQRKEIKDVLAYLQLINNPRDDVALLRVINTPARGIGKKTVSRLVDHAHRRGLPLWEAAREAGMISEMNKRTATLVARFAALMDKLAVAAADPVERIVGLVLSESGYRDHLAQSDHEEDRDRLANIEELLTVARQFDERHPEQACLEVFLEETALVNDTDSWDDASERVTLMTLHAAKGLEFPVVFLTAVEQGLLPHERSREDPAELEEERRLMFVGITRAMDELQISMASRRDFRGARRITIPSPFLMELPRSEMTRVEPDPVGVETVVYDDAYEHEYEHDQVRERREPITGRRSTAESLPLMTGAQLAGSDRASAVVEKRRAGREFQIDTFCVGMAVQHPDYGLGKIAALSGTGPKRTATVNFATAGQRSFVLENSPLRPAGA